MSPTPTRADAVRNRERIIAAAADAFASEGIDVGVAEIARRAGIGNATVFRNFPTKEDLLVAVLETRLGSMLSAMVEAREREQDAAQILYDFMSSCAEMQGSDRALMEAASTHVANHPRLIAVRDAWLAEVSELLAQAQADGSIRPEIEPVDLMLLLFAVSSAARVGSLERTDLHLRYLSIVFAGMATDPDAPRLEPGPPSLEEFEAAKHAAHS